MRWLDSEGEIQIPFEIEYTYNVNQGFGFWFIGSVIKSFRFDEPLKDYFCSRKGELFYSSFSFLTTPLSLG